jgi:hypothetical protein
MGVSIFLFMFVFSLWFAESGSGRPFDMRASMKHCAAGQVSSCRHVVRAHGFCSCEKSLSTYFR